MKGALTPDNQYRFDENGALVANEGESEESRATRESIILYVEGLSPNHPADVAASNGQEVAPEALETPGRRTVSEEAAANDAVDPSYSRTASEDEVEENDMEEVEEDSTGYKGRRNRRK